jgi:hypothetical protein
MTAGQAATTIAGGIAGLAVGWSLEWDWLVVVGIGIGWWVGSVLFPSRRAFLARRIVESDYLLCMNCRYSLRGLKDHDQCPECGNQFDLKEVQKFWRNWLAKRK